MIAMNIGIFVLICAIFFIFGFFVSISLSGSKIDELDKEVKKERIFNNRKDQIINFYKSSNTSSKNSNPKVTDIIKERKSK